jgi:nucleotide-binding universal stress UspA family protein
LKILICTDGSEQADRAIRIGCEIAASCKAEVTLLGIKETAGESAVLLTALTRGQQLLESHKVAAELVTKPGDPIDEIVKRTEELKYDLVVIGAIRKAGSGPFSMSVKAYKIIKLIKPPVLIVIGNSTGLKRILICTGGKGYIESAFDLVGAIAQGVGASVSLLHIMPEPPAIYSEIRELELDVNLVLNSSSELGRNLRRQRDSLTTRSIKTEICLRQGFVLDEIFDEIRGGQYDLIVAGSSLSTGPLRTYVLGDVTREIVNQADCPVLVARRTKHPRNLRKIFGDLLHGFTFRTPPADRQDVKQRIEAEAGGGIRLGYGCRTANTP